jgi:hypothetical protein
VLRHGEIVIRIERDRPVEMMDRPVVVVRDELDHSEREVGFGIVTIETKRLLANRLDVGQSALPHIPEPPFVQSRDAQETVGTCITRIDLDRFLQVFARPTVVGLRVELQVMLRTQHMIVGVEAVRGLCGGDRVGKRR